MSDPYDPTAPEGKSPSSQHVSRKDLRVVIPVLVVLGLAGWPAYIYLLGKVNTTICNKNLRKIGSAMSQYAADNDDHLPFVYESVSYYSQDIGLRKGLAYTWQWQLHQYTGDWDTFRCRAAHEGENTQTSDGSTVEESSYGMLIGYGGLQYSTIPSPGNRFLIAETSKNGASGTSDPLPLRAGGSALADDGFAIGFDNDQEFPNAATKHATRLAFPDSAKFGFSDETDTRHPNGVHFLFADGHLRILNGEAAKVNSLAGGFGSWDVPKKPAPYVPQSQKP